MPSYVIGLDVGNGSVKAAVLKGTLRGYEIEDFLSLDIAEPIVRAEDTQPMPVMSPAAEGHTDEDEDADESVDSPVGDEDEDEDEATALPVAEDPTVTAAVRAVRRARSDAVRTILETIGQPQAVLVTSVPAEKASTWIIDLPFSDPKRIEQTIDFEVENYVPWDLDDVLLDYEVLGLVDDGSRVLTAMVPRDTVAAELLVMADAGADPKHLCIDALELARLVPATDEAVAVIDIGSERTLVCVAQGGSARWIRSIDGGADDFPEAVFEPDSVVLPEPPAPVDWIRALRGTLLAAQESGAPEMDSLVLCGGGGSRQDGLAGQLADDLGIPVSALQMPAALVNPEDAPVPEPEHALAYALALRGFARKKKDGVVLDFRRGEFAWRADSKLYARLAVGVVAAIVLLGLGFVGNHFLELKGLQDQLDASQGQMVATVQGAFPDVPETSLMTPEQSVAVMNEKVLALNERVAALQGFDMTPLAALKEISEAVPKTVVVDVDEFMINDEMVRIRGTTDSYGSVDTIEAQIKGRPMFAQAEKSDVNKDREGRARFVVRAPREPVEEEDEG